MTPELEILLNLIEQKLDWGKAESWQSRDFEKLNELILDETGVSLSASTLRRIWGRVEYNHLPSTTTLDTLAKYAGYSDWRMFARSKGTKPTVPGQKMIRVQSLQKPARSRASITWVIVLLIGIGLAGIFAVKQSHRPLHSNDYSLTIEPLTRTIPNSVVFTYDASLATVDSVFIQQSWDVRTRVAVEKSAHKHTCIYYEPGFYEAKLFIGKEIVRECPLMIPTQGWLGIIEHQPVPVYLDSTAFIFRDKLALPLTEIAKNNITLQPQPPLVKYFNVGNFEPVPVSKLSFKAEMMNEYREGSSACQLSAFMLVTDGKPIIMTFGVIGCAAEFYLMSVDHEAIGKMSDLSKLAVDFSKWAQVSCKSSGGNIQFLVNGKMAYEFPLPAKDLNIVGISFFFQGTGSVKHIQLGDADKVVFQAF